MLHRGRAAAQKLSTPAFLSRRFADNRGMNDAPSAGLGRFLTIADAADLLNVSPAQVRKLVLSGELPAIRVGAPGQWRVERDVLEGYIDALYEQARRHSLWNQAEFDQLPEYTFGERR
jgi:excisionase family DNA binding protein